MPENTSNPLYQNLQSTAQDVKNAYANMPTFMNTMQSGVVGNDQVLNSNINDYSSAVNELFAHDKAMAASNTTPSFAQGVEGYVSNPMTAEKYEAEMFAQKGERVASSLNRMEKRKAFLGDLVDKAVKLYEIGLQGKISDRDFALEMDKFNEQVRATKAREALDAATLNEGKTAKERIKKEALAEAERLAKEGVTINGLFENFAGNQYVDKDEILKVYKDVNYYKKPPEETASELSRKWKAASEGFAANDLLASLTNDERKTIQPKAAVVGQLLAVTEKMKELSGGDPNFLDSFKAGQFGLYKNVDKVFSNNQQLRQMIARISAAERKDIFGATLTPGEQKDAEKWLAGGKKELPNQLWSKLLAAIDFNKSQVNSIFQDRGISQKEINDYWNKKSQLELSSTSSNNSSGSSSDPLGIL